MEGEIQVLACQTINVIEGKVKSPAEISVDGELHDMVLTRLLRNSEQ